MKLPFYAKMALLLVGLYVLVQMLFVTQDIVLPFIFAAIFAMALSPAVDFLIRRKMNDTVAITIVLLVAVLTIGGLIALLSSQTSLLSKAMPQLTTKFLVFYTDVKAWFSAYFNVSSQKIDAFVNNARSEITSNMGSAIGMTLMTVGGFLSVVFLMPVYIFMMLSYQAHLVEFMRRVCGSENDEKVREIMTETRGIIQSYLVGLFLEFAIVAVLNTLCLVVLGIDYAILFSVMGALLNVIPYIGGIITIFLFMVIAFVTKSPIYAVYIFGLYSFIQLIDNNYIVPKVIGSKVRLNALVCLLAVILGAALWGVPGMFLSIPLTAIIKLIFDRIDSLKPWGYLLGDDYEPLTRFTLNLKDFSNQLPRVRVPFRK